MTPRDYQRAAKAAVLRELLEVGRRSTAVVKPTGVGKTVLFADLAADWPYGRVLVLAHRRLLLDQAAEKIVKATGQSYVPLEMGESSVGYFGGKVMAAGVASLHEDRIGKFDPGQFGLLVVDECHRCAWQNITYARAVGHFQRNPRCKLVGVTATIDRTDRAALVGAGRMFESVAYEYPLWAESGPCAIRDGWLVPPVQGFAVCEGLSLADCKLNRRGDFTDEELTAVLAEEEMLHRAALPIREKAGDRKTLVFCANIAHAAGFERDGKRHPGLADVLGRYAPGKVRAVHGRMGLEQRAAEIQRFRDGFTQFLVSCDLLIEGFDDTTVSCVAVCRPTKSRSRYAQMVGRGLRPHQSAVEALNAAASAEGRRQIIAGSCKPDCLVIDQVGLGDLRLAVSVAELLEGCEDDHPAVLLAKKRAAQRPGASDMAQLVSAAKASLWEEAVERSLAERSHLVATGQWHWQPTDPFGRGAPSAALTGRKPPRRPATDKQVAALVGLGVAGQTARSYSVGQAGCVIDSLRQHRCSAGQAKVLARAGHDPAEFNFFRASEVIEALKANNWQRAG